MLFALVVRRRPVVPLIQKSRQKRGAVSSQKVRKRISCLQDVHTEILLCSDDSSNSDASVIKGEYALYWALLYTG